MGGAPSASLDLPAHPTPGRALLRWGLRLLGLSLVAAVLITQVHWWDRVDLTDGTRIEGRIVEVAGNEWVIEEVGGARRRIARDSVRVHRDGERAVPALSWGAASLLGRLKSRVPLLGLVLLLLTGLVVLTAHRWHLLLRATACSISPRQAIRFTFIGGFFNIAIPGATGGDVVKAYLAARWAQAPTRAVVSVLVDRVLGLLGLVVLAGVVLFLLPVTESARAARLLVALALGTALLLVVAVTARPIRRFLGLGALFRRLPFQPLLAEIRQAVRLYRDHRGVLLAALVLSILNQAGIALAVFGLAQGLGLDGVDVWACAALVPVANLVSAVPLLPGGWGVGEWAFAFFFGEVGLAPTEAVALSVVYRLSTLAVHLPGGLLWIGRAKGRRPAAQPSPATLTKPGEDLL